VIATSFTRIAEVAAAEGFSAVDAILFDLGISSYHLESSGRGFSFERDEPLDLRFDDGDPSTPSAAELLRRLPTEDLAGILRTYGEERYARRIARHVGRARVRHPIRTAVALRECVLDALPGPARRQGRRSVARVFQALRIVVNAELDAIEHALPQVPGLLRPGGRVAVIAFHSLEDRIVKNFFRGAARDGELVVVTKKPLRPSAAELARNPRAASARLRVAERV
jgi:16S rRNA (cytosine1402-N4)-methyltransferase